MLNNLLYLYNGLNYEMTTALVESLKVNLFTADSIEAACAAFTRHPIHLLLVELKLKNGNGLDFIRHLREKGVMTPVVIVIDDTDKYDLIEAINLNVTQCLSQPYTQQDLCNALKIAAKKSDLCHPLAYTDLNFGYAYNPLNKSILTSEGESIKLCRKEALLIELLLQNSEYITSYEMIENIVWEDSFMSIESLRTLIRAIRKKTHPNIITNHNGIGYQLNVCDTSA